LAAAAPADDLLSNLLSMRYRLIDTAGGEIAIIDDDRDELTEGDEIQLPDGLTAAIIEIYDDEHGREGGVDATVVVE
jgi:hypothetical protein